MFRDFANSKSFAYLQYKAIEKHTVMRIMPKKIFMLLPVIMLMACNASSSQSDFCAEKSLDYYT